MSTIWQFGEHRGTTFRVSAEDIESLARMGRHPRQEMFALWSKNPERVESMNNDEFFARTTIKDPPEVATRIIWQFLNSFTYFGPKEDEPIYHFQRIHQRSGTTSKPVKAAYLRSTARTLRETARMLKQARLRKNPKLYPKLDRVLGIELGLVYDFIFRVLGERMGFGPGMLARLLVQRRIFEVEFSPAQPPANHA